jgi:hypothetical protein
LADASRFPGVDFPLVTPSGTQVAVEILRVPCACQCLAQIERQENKP